MLPNYRYLFLHLLFILNSSIFAQNSSESIGLANNTNSLPQINATELIYLQTSKGIYEAGEDVVQGLHFGCAVFDTFRVE